LIARRLAASAARGGGTQAGVPWYSRQAAGRRSSMGATAVAIIPTNPLCSGREVKVKSMQRCARQGLAADKR